jgi:hypothetical protein
MNEGDEELNMMKLLLPWPVLEVFFSIFAFYFSILFFLC